MTLYKKECQKPLQILDTAGYFEGYANVFNTIDHHNDVVLPGAFQKSIQKWKNQKRWPKMLWQHDEKYIIGLWHDMYEDDKGLYVKGQLLLDLPKAQEAHALLKAKALDSLSIGYSIKKSSNGMLYNKNVQFLNELSLSEISLVTFPSNEDSKVSFVKNLPYFNQSQPDLLEALQQCCFRLQDFAQHLSFQF
ncbi:MAG: HK97 family phage prohead protease [Candidatus Puniceispirillum sp.]|nr:HK97 family phage prohead protease [Candidatus Pelagibacter sp.]MBA4283530.1 HK97 family phage prohead protease [Candidatus Puniceispirillum sp.]